jgi:hypothetical protein
MTQPACTDGYHDGAENRALAYSVDVGFLAHGDGQNAHQ